MAVKNQTLLAAAAALLFAAAALYLLIETPSRMPPKQIHIDSHAIFVDVAETPAAREQGLSGHAPLLDGQGMLFVFDSDDQWGIWMKDMLFPLDIIWADNEGVVVSVAENAAPDSYPQVFLPSAPARYVLEVPAGYAARNGVAEGSQLVL